MTNSDPPQPEASDTLPSTVRMEVHGSQRLAHRRFAQVDLRSIETILLNGPFDSINWEFTDQQGTTSGTNLSEILRNLLWESVKDFSLQAVRQSYGPSGFDFLAQANYIYIRLWTSISVSWHAAPENRQPVELTYNRLVHFLKDLPVNRGFSSRFTDAPQKPAWWNPFKSPRSMIDWIVVGVLTALAVTTLTAVALLVPKIF